MSVSMIDLKRAELINLVDNINLAMVSLNPLINELDYKLRDLANSVLNLEYSNEMIEIANIIKNINKFKQYNNQQAIKTINVTTDLIIEYQLKNFIDNLD